MIVVIGAVFGRGAGAELAPGGLAAGIALAAAAEESRVELVARIGDDSPGDALLLAIAAAGVGHVATLRDPARSTPIVAADEDATDPDPDAQTTADASVDPGGSNAAPTLDGADVGLALRYLADYRVIVVVHPTEPGVLTEAVAAAAYVSAHLVVVTDPAAPDATAPDTLPAAALVLTATDDAAGVGDLIGRYAAAVDRGDDPATAFAAMAAVGA